MRDILSVPQSLPKATMASHLDLTSLQLIINVAEAATITHGARRSHLSLAAASERIRILEAAVGTPLFERQRRGVKLTAAGSVVVRHAAAALKQLEQMTSEIGRHAKGKRVRVRVLSNTVGMLEYLPKALTTYLAAHPRVDVDLEEMPSRQVVHSISAGRADIGIVGGPLDAEASEIETVPLAKNRLVLLVPGVHPLARVRRTSFATALEHEWVGLNTSTILGNFVDEQARLIGRPPTIRVRLGSFDAIGAMVARGVGVAVVPEATAHRWAKSAMVKVVTLKDAWAVRHLTICTRRSALLSTEARNLFECLTSAVVRPASKPFWHGTVQHRKS
jgi:DNA-binding transcriptional LysR family regulator